MEQTKNVTKSSKGKPLNIQMTTVARSRLERLRESTQAETLADVVRRALAVYEFLCQEQSNGAQLRIRRPDDDTDRELVLL